MKSIYWRMIVFPVLIMYLEIIFHIAIYGAGNGNLLYPVLFGAAAGTAVSLLTVIFKKNGNAVFAYAICFIISFYYVIQLIYYKIFGMFLSLVSVGGAENAMNFKVVLFEAIRNNIGWLLLLLFVPIAVIIILQIFFVSFERPDIKQNLINAGTTAVLWTAVILSLNLKGRGVYSPYDLFHNHYVLELSMDKLGVLVTTARDAAALVFGDHNEKSFTLNEEAVSSVGYMPNKDTGIVANDSFGAVGYAKVVIEHIGEKGIQVVYTAQVDDSIDFVSLYNSTDDEELKNLTAYFSDKEPSMTNEFTGSFEGYNVIFVTAESLSRYGIFENCTPTLYKIMNEGMVFDNFYNPIWYHSTIDGEYVNCLGQYPCSSDWSFYKSEDTYQPYALGNALNALGYTSKAYHDFTFYYYDRSVTHANMGYDFKAIDYGLDIPYYTPYSDLDTMEAVYEEFINEDQFLMYFMSFSGHLPYNYEYNAMSLKNRQEAETLTEGMNLSDESVAYIAAQMELDKALEFLIEKLDEAGKLDNTLFIVTPDHYPYGLSDTAYNELAGFDISDDRFELHRACLGIWSASMEQDESLEYPYHVEKLCASVDILPTVLNLLGVNYDSRLLAGNDIMSDAESLVIFSDHSFMTDSVKYNASTGETDYLDDSEVTEQYIADMIEEVETRLYISDKMIDNDFFSFLMNKTEVGIGF